MDRTLFIKCKNHVKVSQGKVVLKDVAEVYSADTALANKARTVAVTHLQKEGSRKVLSVLYIMHQLERALPGIVMQSIGENDVIVEWGKKQRLEAVKVAFISLIAFFGTSFTIMAFHNDIGIRDVFAEIYNITRGNTPEGVGVLEFSYCIGLFIGISVFFNHIGKKKFTEDPTPVAVAMYNYEKDVNQTIIEDTERRGEEESE